MKTIKKDELYQGLSDFLKSKGIEFRDGAFPNRINRACELLTDAINETQKTVKRAKVKVDEKLDQLRRSIHEATAPKPPSASATSKTARPDYKNEGAKSRRKRPPVSSKSRRARRS